jgi:hypothetical protein
VIEWLTIVIIAVAIASGLLCLVLGLSGRAPSDLSLGSMLLVELVLLVQIVVAIVAPLAGNRPTGNGLEFWLYLITALLLPPLAVIWALVERSSRWSTVVLAVAAFAVAVMTYRMGQIWFVQVA